MFTESYFREAPFQPPKRRKTCFAWTAAVCLLSYVLVFCFVFWCRRDEERQAGFEHVTVSSLSVRAWGPASHRGTSVYPRLGEELNKTSRSHVSTTPPGQIGLSDSFYLYNDGCVITHLGQVLFIFLVLSTATLYLFRSPGSSLLDCAVFISSERLVKTWATFLSLFGQVSQTQNQGHIPKQTTIFKEPCVFLKKINK